MSPDQPVLRLRVNAYSGREETRIAAQYLDRRIELTRETPAGRYLYVVDPDQKIWLAPNDALLRENDPDSEVKHSSLLPLDQGVYSAGILVINAARQVGLNASSGHYMAEDPILGEEQLAWQSLLTTLFVNLGYTVVELHCGIMRIQLRDNS